VSVPVAVFVFGTGDIVALIVTLNRLVVVATGNIDTDKDAWLSAVGAAEGDVDVVALGDDWKDGDGTADDEPRTVAVSLREPSAVDDDDVVGDDVRTAPIAKREPAADPT
jgi:hypothetical protein